MPVLSRPSCLNLTETFPHRKCDFEPCLGIKNKWMSTTTWGKTGSLSVKQSKPEAQHQLPKIPRWSIKLPKIKGYQCVTQDIQLQCIPSYVTYFSTELPTLLDYMFLFLYTQTTAYTYQSVFIPLFFYSWWKNHIIVFTYDPHMVNIIKHVLLLGSSQEWFGGTVQY